MKKIRNLRERMRRWVRSNRDGLLLAGIVVAVAFLMGTLNGCGNALQVSARALTVATVATQGAEDVAAVAMESDVAACSDHTCLDGIAPRYAAANAASESARAALVAWDGVLQIAVVAGEGGDVLRALVAVAARFVSRWDALAEALRALGHDMPPLPESVRSVMRLIGEE